jgi:hypothetical protein
MCDYLMFRASANLGGPWGHAPPTPDQQTEGDAQFFEVWQT